MPYDGNSPGELSVPHRCAHAAAIGEARRKTAKTTVSQSQRPVRVLLNMYIQEGMFWNAKEKELHAATSINTFESFRCCFVFLAKGQRVWRGSPCGPEEGGCWLSHWDLI